MKGKLYLIPTTLGDSPTDHVIPGYIKELVPGINHFIVENIRTARRYLKKLYPQIDIDNLTFYELNKHASPGDLQEFLNVLDNFDLGVITEAGCPGVADPGADVVKLAHKKGIRVVPLTGPSSILLALMASGLNGQNFAFNGYLPVKAHERVKKIKQLEQRSFNESQTQIFIETPYRNMQLLQSLIENCHPSTLLCIACDLTLESEFVKTLPVKEWKKQDPALHKRPTIYLLHRFR